MVSVLARPQGAGAGARKLGSMLQCIRWGQRNGRQVSQTLGASILAFGLSSCGAPALAKTEFLTDQFRVIRPDDRRACARIQCGSERRIVQGANPVYAQRPPGWSVFHPAISVQILASEQGKTRFLLATWCHGMSLLLQDIPAWNTAGLASEAHPSDRG